MKRKEAVQQVTLRLQRAVQDFMTKAKGGSVMQHDEHTGPHQPQGGSSVEGRGAHGLLLLLLLWWCGWQPS